MIIFAGGGTLHHGLGRRCETGVDGDGTRGGRSGTPAHAATLTGSPWPFFSGVVGDGEREQLSTHSMRSDIAIPIPMSSLPAGSRVMRVSASFISAPFAFKLSCRMASTRASVSVGKADL